MYYNQKKIYQKFIHVKDMPCHVTGMTSELSRSDKIQEIERIASGDYFYWIIQQTLVSNASEASDSKHTMLKL